MPPRGEFLDKFRVRLLRGVGIAERGLNLAEAQERGEPGLRRGELLQDFCVLPLRLGLTLGGVGVGLLFDTPDQDEGARPLGVVGEKEPGGA